MSCPNCERLREALINAEYSVMSDMSRAEKNKDSEYLEVVQRRWSGIKQALALPSEEKDYAICHIHGKFYSGFPECPVCKTYKEPAEKSIPSESVGKCEHDKGWYWCDGFPQYHDVPLKRDYPKCIFCAPVKKEPGEKSPEEVKRYDFSASTIKCHEMIEHREGSWVNYSDYSKAIRSERSTAQKDCGREEAMMRVVDAAKDYMSVYGTKTDDDFIYPKIQRLNTALDAMEALEKRRKV